MSRAQNNIDLITTLGKLGSLDISKPEPAPKFSAQKIISGAMVYILLEGILDKEKEIEKLEKEIEKTKGFMISLQKKLSNEKFVSGAPEKVVAFEREKLATQEDILKKATEALENLK
jgi:valyl-tRNA synthetase